MDICFFDMLPVRIQLKEAETITSVVTRVAEGNRIKKKRALNELLFMKDTRHLYPHTDFPFVGMERLSIISGIPHERLFLASFYYLATNFGRSPQIQKVSRFLSETLTDTLRYCPKCLAEDPYYRIFWRFTHVSVCNQHGCLLLDRCGHCGQKIPLFSMPPKMAVCPYCGAHLWKFEAEIPNLDIRKVEQEYIALEILLKPVTDWNFYKSTDFTKFIGYKLREYRRAHHIRLDTIAEKTGLSKRHIGVLEYGSQKRKYLGFQLYQVYLKALGLSMYDVLTQGSVPYEPIPKERARKRLRVSELSDQTREEFYEQQVKDAIEKLKKSNARVTIVAIARVIGVSASLLYSYPKLRNLLPRLNDPSNIRYEKKSREATRQLQDAWNQLYSEEKIPTRDELIKHLGTAYFDYFPEARAWLGQAWRTARLLTKAKFEASVIDELNKIGTAQSGEESALSKSAISRQLGISRHVLMAYPRIWQRIREMTRHTNPYYRAPRIDEDEVVHQVQKIQEELRAQNIRITQCRIAALMQKSVPSLKKYPKVRVIFDEIGRSYKERNKPNVTSS